MRTRTPFEEKLLALIEPAAADLGYAIVRIRLRGAIRKTLEVRAERVTDHQMSASDCETLSRALSPVLDVADIIKDRYDLEVSSPGMDRPLTRLADFDTWAGFEARLELDRMVEGRKRFKGELAGTEGDQVLIELPGEEGQAAAIPFDWLHEARLVITDDLITESLRRRAAAGLEEEAGEGAAPEELPEEIAVRPEREPTLARPTKKPASAKRVKRAPKSKANLASEPGDEA